MPKAIKITTLALALAALAAWLRSEPTLVEVPSTLVYPAFWHTPMGVHRGTPALLRAFLGNDARFANPQGVACALLSGTTGGPDQITAVGVNSGRSELVYNPDMKSLRRFGSWGRGPGRFKGPIGAALRPNGMLAIGDTGNDRVALLQMAEGELAWRGELGVGQLDTPTWVDWDHLGRLWVSDTGHDRVVCLAADGSLALSTTPGVLMQPQALAVRAEGDPLSEPGLPSALYVVDQHRGRIQCLDKDGKVAAQAWAETVGQSTAYFTGLALDWRGNLFVADRASHRIHKLSAALEWIDSWGREGEGDGELRQPRGLAIWRPLGQVLVLEADSAQYLWLGADILDLNLSRQGTPGGGAFLRADFRLTERAHLEAWLESLDGERLRRLAPGLPLPAGANAVTWDGALQDGSQAPPGRYVLALLARATYSSRDHAVRRVAKSFRLR